MRPENDFDSFAPELFCQKNRDVVVLAGQQAWTALNQRDFAAQAGKSLRELAADRSSP